MINLPVVPLCKNQLKDIRPKDILNNGLYRKCNTYRGGGGYDQFNKIYEKRFKQKVDPTQFVVQLKGCPLNCPYCYVTRDGVFNNSKNVSLNKMLQAYENSKCEVFHLMGGAPAIYLEHWKEIAEQVRVFHSDFLLVEHTYDINQLNRLPGLYAVSIKEPYIYTNAQMALLYKNLKIIVDSGINFYITFTGKPILRKSLLHYFGKSVFEDSFNIDIKKYKAINNEKFKLFFKS